MIFLRHFGFVILLFVLNANTLFAAPDDVPPGMLEIANNTVICGFKNNVLPENVPAHVFDVVGSVGGITRHTYTNAFKGFSAHMSQAAVNAIVTNNPNIAFCENNGLVRVGGNPSTVSAGGKGGNGGKPGQATPQIVPQGVTRVGGPIDATGLTAWVIDSGIDLDHPDLNVDASRGYDAVNSVGKGKSTFDDVNGHGTHVAGTLAAIDNDIDVVGVAAGATVVPVRVLAASNFGYIDDAIAGIDYVAANASSGDIANMSVWGWNHNQALHTAAYNLAEVIPFIVIAGNDGIDLNEQPAEPAHVEHQHLYTVSAIYQDDVFTSFSNWGFAENRIECGANSEYGPYPCSTVDYAAPGDDVTSLKPGGGLATWFGTSMAAPHVAGVILLLQNKNIRPNTSGSAINDPDAYSDPISHH